MKKIQLSGHRYKAVPIKGYALIDDTDFHKVSAYKWSMVKRRDKFGEFAHL